MPIIRKQDALKDVCSDGDVRWHFSAELFSDTGGLTQFGAFTETLPLGAQSSELHWHDHEDEFVYLISGTLVLVEGDETGITETIMQAGDASSFKAGVATGHSLINRSDAAATYLVVGTRAHHDQWHYPLKDEHIERHGKKRVVRNGKGEIMREYEK